MSALIHVIGLGVSESAVLAPEARSALAAAQCIVGSARQLETVGHLNLDSRSFVELPKLDKLEALIETSLIKGSVAVLASGDPLYFGIGKWFGKHFAAHQLCFYPAVSSIQAACHRLGYSLQDVTVLSLHGRPLSNIRRHLKRGQTLVILTDQHSVPNALAEECRKARFTDSRITVCERLGYGDEAVRSFAVGELLHGANTAFDPLHVSVIEVDGPGGVLPEFPGIPDAAYETGAVPGQGMISKREVRLTILSLLQPARGDVIWDVGAGCGGVAVELAHWNEHLSVHAIEHHPQRLQYLEHNRERFGVRCNLHTVAATAPDCFEQLPAANKVFIGGSGGRLPQLFAKSWAQLPAGGVLVVSAVIEKTRRQLYTLAEELSQGDIEIVEVAVKRDTMNGLRRETLARLPVQVFKFTKSVASASVDNEP